MVRGIPKVGEVLQVGQGFEVIIENAVELRRDIPSAQVKGEVDLSSMLRRLF
jgi:hypothetical protein